MPPVLDESRSRQTWPDSGGLTTRRGKLTVGELSGEGGLLLTSLNVDSVSIGDKVKEDGGPMSTGLGWTLDGLMDVSICNR